MYKRQGRGGGGQHNQLLLPAVVSNLQTNGFWFVAKVGAVERHSVFMPWGPGVLTEQQSVDITDAILYFQGPSISGSGTFASITVRINNAGAGYLPVTLLGNGDTLPANSTVECYEAGVFMEGA